MTTIRHHVSDRLLMAYATGSLPEAFGLVIATHLSLCDECRARLGAFDAVGGQVIEGCEAEMAAGSLDACLARLGVQERRVARPQSKPGCSRSPCATRWGAMPPPCGGGLWGWECARRSFPPPILRRRGFSISPQALRCLITGTKARN